MPSFFTSLKPLLAIIAVCFVCSSLETSGPQTLAMSQSQFNASFESPELARKRKELIQVIFKTQKSDNVAKFLKQKKCKA